MQKKVGLINICITILICCLFSFLTLCHVDDVDGVKTVSVVNDVEEEDNSGNDGIVQTQTILINSVQTDKVDLNSASIEELKSLNNVGGKLAEKIISNRPYNSVWDLKAIVGIGEDTINSIKGEVECK